MLTPALASLLAAASVQPSIDTSVPLWVPVATLVIGALVTLAVAYLQSRTARADRQHAALERREDREAERAARGQERHQRLGDEHRAFQRDTLIELQEQVSAYLRLNGKAGHADEMAWKAAGEPTDRFLVSQLPEGLSEEINISQRRIQVLPQRVDDDAVRDGVRELVDAANAIADPPDKKPPASAAKIRLGTVFQALNNRIGEILRTLPMEP